MHRLGFTGRLAVWSAYHRVNMVLAWIALLLVTLVLAQFLGGNFRTDYEFTNTQESQQARDILRAFRGGDPLNEIILVQSASTRADDEAFRERVTAIVRDLRAQEAIVAEKTVSYLDLPNGGGLVSADGRSALILTVLEGDLNNSGEGLAVLHAVLGQHAGGGYTVRAGGVASINQAFTQAAEHDLAMELNVLPVALVVLVVVFGAVVTAFVPLGVAFMAIGVTFAVVTLLSNAWELSIFATNVITGIGLAVGIDYVLFIVARYREERRLGHTEEEALGIAGDTASRAVLFSGATVVIALLGMLIVPSTIFRSFAIGATAVVVVAVLAALTLLPAVLGMLGRHVDALALPWSRSASIPGANRGFWAGMARFVMWRAPRMALYSSIALLVLTAPWLTLRLGASGAGAIPERFETRQVFDVVNREFSGGLLAPTSIVVRAPNIGVPEVAQSLGKLQIALGVDPQIRQIAPMETSPRADLAVLTVALPGDGTSAEALEALERLRTRLIPASFGESTAEVYVGGFTAMNADFFAIIRAYTPVVFAFVLGLSFVLLLLIFRSIVVPLKSIVMNLLSVGAAYGVITAIFQHGWGASALGLQHTPRIEAWVPLFMFTILFGLSMDYHIFLL
ncbi:MAG: MMPL family transporter, partial [Dehalococcoidia bacterium]